LQNFWESPTSARLTVANLVDYLACEVRNSVQAALLQDQELAAMRRSAGLKPTTLDWLKGYAAQITLTLTVDEKSALNPGIALNSVFPNATTAFVNHPSVSTPQSFSLGLAGAFSTEATRKETLSLYLDLKDAVSTKQLAIAKANGVVEHPEACNQVGGGMIESGIKFRDWLLDVTLPAAVEGGVVPNYSQALSGAAKALKKDAISHEVTFVVIYGGNVTPTWKLVNISANQGSAPFFSVQRTNTQDVIITLGPAQEKTLSVAAQNTILASQIGIAVANAIRNTQQ
jgi:hypothetical protein